MRKTFLILLIFVILAGCTVLSQTSPKTPGKTAGETMKNVQVLKDVPAGDWRNLMVFINASLGVSCEHCHAEPFDADTKKAKQTARTMMKMVHEINAANFENRPVITCNTCHQGSLKPKGIPSLWNKTPDEVAAYRKQRQADLVPAAPQPAAASTGSSQPLPAAEQVFTSYHRAVGLAPVKSIHLAANVSGELQPPTSLELDVVYPDKMLAHITAGKSDVRSGVNGERGWMVTPQAKRDLPPSDIEKVKENFMQIVEPVKFPQAQAAGKVVGIEKIQDRQYTVVESETPKRFQRLYFDSQSGLLYKAYLENRVAGFGSVPNELTYEDYRDVGGVKFPFSIVASSVADRVHMKITEIQTNATLDPAKFEPPAAPASAPASK
jgi:hypothetical protein